MEVFGFIERVALGDIMAAETLTGTGEPNIAPTELVGNFGAGDCEA